MLCIHGLKVIVILSPVSPPHWDDGVKRFDCYGNETFDDISFLKCLGCPECTLILAENVQE
jgi:hypothetical protein